MRSLQIPLHAFRAEHAAVEGEFLPRFKANNLIAADLQLNAALLAAEAAMRLHEPIWLDGGGEARPRHHGSVRAERCRDAQVVNGNRSHVASGMCPPQGALRQSQQGATASW